MKTMKKYIFALIATMFLPLSMMAQNVAKIDDTEYATLAEAVAAATDGQTIDIIADVTELEDGSELSINKSLTITGAVDGSGNPLYTISGKSSATGTNDIFITGSGTVTLSNLKIKNFGNNAASDIGHAPIYVSTNFTGTVNLTNLYVSDFNRGGIFLYGGEFNVDNCYIDCANSRSGAFTKGIEIKGSANGTIQNTFICNMERSTAAYASAAIEIYGSGDVTVDGCSIVSNDGSHSTVKATYGIVIDKVGAYDPSNGTLHITNTMTNTTNSSVTVSGGDNYTVIVDECDFDNYIATWSATSSITLNSGSFAEDVYADAGTININGGEFSSFAPYEGTNGTIIINAGTFDNDEFIPYLSDDAVIVDIDGDGNYVIAEESVDNPAVASVTTGATTIQYASVELAFATVADGSTITLLTDATLSENIDCPLTAGALTMTFGDYTITKGDYSVSLATGVTVTTDKQTDIFTDASGDIIVETSVGTGYKYSAQTLVAKVESQSYVTFEEAVTAAGSEKVITLLADIAASYTLSEGQTLKVAKNGHTITIVAPTDFEVYEEVVTIDAQEVTVYGLKTDISPFVIGTLSSTYTGSVLSAPLVIKDGEYTLVKGTDYKLQVGGVDVEDVTSTDAGLVEFTVVGINKYNKSKNVTWTIYKDINSEFIQIEVDPAIYTTADITPKDYVHVYDKSTTPRTELEYSTDYTIEVSTTVKDAKTYVNAITVKGTKQADKYISGETTFSMDVQPQNLSSFVVTATAPYVEGGYGANNAESGAAIKAATTIVIKDGNGTVWTNYEGFEVTIDNDPTAANNYNNTGTYTGVVHVAVKPDYASNFTGAVPAGDLTIGTGTDIISSLVVNTIDAMYTAGQLPPSENTLEVKLGSQVLTYGTDFDIIVNGEESDYVDAKTYHNAVIIKGKGAYYGSFIADYTIRPRSLGDEYIEVKATNLDYTGDDQDVTVVVKYKKNDVENVIPEDNYTFTPTTANEAGKYVITVNAVDNSNLLGSTTTDLWVFKSMETYADDFIVEPDPIPTQTATGSEIKPEVVVKDNNRTLVFGEDYNVTYSDNIDPGEATITITGMYAYSGTITRHFTIVPEYFVVDEITYHHALAGEEVTVGKKENDENVLATTLTGDVTVPATIHYSDKDFTVVGIEENAFSGDAIYTLTLPESIETIANKSFSNCSNLRWLDLTAMVGYTPSTLDRISDRGPFSKVPKQTLVFLEGTTTSGENYIYKYGDNDFRCDMLKIYEDLKGDQTGYNQANGYKWGFLNPYEFKANTVTNTRQLNATNAENKQQGYTICLPYALPVPNAVSAYTLMASKNDLLGFEPVDGNTLAALTPYVLIPETTGQLLSTTDATIVKTTDADLTATAVRSAAADGQKTYAMYGSMTYMDDVTGAYIMQSGNVWKQIETAGSYDGATNKACILPMRAYIMPDSSPAPVLYSVFGMPGTTGMSIFERIDVDVEDGQLYDLQGRPVTAPTRGIYVRNGKKVVIK